MLSAGESACRAIELLLTQPFAFAASQGAADCAALRVRCVARFDGDRQNSALRASDRLPLFFPPNLRYSPA